jgi:UDP-N-acetylglucosamine--N-acetylmuramyl-(pentapeptide) pyrophosphoryl-undecaprenol N-acetylglucosamine transferase
MLKVLIATGGSGGHLFPSRQLAELLKGCEVIFAGHKLENTPFFDRKVPYHEIASASSKKKWPILLKGLWQSIKLLFRFKPDVVVGFGSFHSFPVLMAAAILRKKIILFEANGSLGKVNRFFVPFAEKLALQFPIPHKKAVYVPLLPWTVKPSSGKKYEKDPKRMTILVFGGSQGAAFINKTFCEAAKLLTFPFQVIHLTGKEDPEVNYSVPAVVKSFEEDMAAAYAVADMAVCRCGAGTTAELIRYKIPAVLIPYPYAHDHQRKNGEFLKNGARMLLQKDANPVRLASEIEKLKEQIEAHKKALSEIAFPKTTDFGALVRAVGEKK